MPICHNNHYYIWKSRGKREEKKRRKEKKNTQGEKNGETKLKDTGVLGPIHKQTL